MRGERRVVGGKTKIREIEEEWGRRWIEGEMEREMDWG